LIEAIAAANPRTVVVLNNGAPIVMPWADHVAAILQMWYPGQEGAKATSDILTGAASPGGRLPVTFPRRLEDGPTADPARYPGVDGHGEYSEGILVGYRWYDTQHVEPLFPFGHGLSYTTFAYSNASFVKTADGLSLRVTVKNTGTRAGDEVVQVYAGPPPSPAVPIAAKSLAAFQRVTLAPGAAQVLTLPLEPHAWSYWSTSTHAWEIAPGMRTFSIGASSRDIRLTLDLDIAHR
jgi:beta-glucosidase